MLTLAFPDGRVKWGANALSSELVTHMGELY